MYQKKHLFFYLFFVLMTNALFSQTISGTITNENGTKIKTANIIIKEARNSDKIKGFTIAKNGTYTIKLKNNMQSIFVEVSAIGYSKITQEITNKKAIISLDFVLKKQKIETIKEVIIKKTKFTLKKDTVVYNASSYKNITDTKLQDVLKRMPGITVNEKTGAIKYNNKPIEKVKLEGDDLFGSNYTIGTKNINADIVQKVEVIKRYSDNELLKGIEHSDKVALNLKLKKGKIDFSGNIDWANGFDANTKQLHLINSTLLQVAKKYKSFFNLSYNNVGVNNSPYDNFSNNKSILEQNNQSYTAEKILSDLSFSGGFLKENRINRNNQFFGSYNLVFKPTKKISTRLNLSYLKDKITQDLYNKTQLLNENYSISDDYNASKKPELYKIELYSKANTSKNSLLEYTLSSFKRNTHQLSSITQNGTKNYINNTTTKDTFVKQSLNFTYKLNTKSALQINTNYAYNDIPQEATSTPSFFINQNDFFESQLSHFKKQILDFQLVYLRKSRKHNYLFSLGNINEINDYNSNIKGVSNQINTDNYTNSFRNKKRSFYTFGKLNFVINKFFVQPSVRLTYLNQQLNDKDFKLSKENLLLEPKLFLKYKLNKVSLISGVLQYKQEPFRENKLITNPVFVNNRNTINSRPTLEIQRTLTSNLSYSINNLYKQIGLNLRVSHDINKGNYFSEYTISPYVTNSTFFYTPNTRSRTGINFSVGKYISFLEGTIKFQSSAYSSNYQNIINNSDFRKVKNNTYDFSISWKTSFDFKLNFENTASYRKSTSSIEKSHYKNSIQSFNNSFKIIAKPHKKVFISTNFDYFSPNTDKKQHYLFIDGRLKYTLNKKWNFTAVARNVLNKTLISETDVNDYSINTTETLIIPRYFLLSTGYNF